MLTLVGVVNYLDRQILGLLLPQIKIEFHLSDTALGLLAGPVFALIYGLMGVPLALLADRGNRRTIIAASLAIFSFTTLACGMAGNFLQLICARFGTGAGEAGVTPAVNALVSDIYAPQHRTGAMAVYSASGNMGIVLAFFGGGLIAQHWGWRAAFVSASLLGFAVVLAFLLIVREPVRQAVPVKPSLLATLRLLWTRRAFRFIAAGAGLVSISGYSALAFVPSFLVRSHHMTPATVGLTLALTAGFVGMMGTMLPGLLADRFGKGDVRWGLYAAVLAIAFAMPIHPVFYLASDLRSVLAAMVVGAFCSSTFLGPCYAAVQGLAPPGMRAQAAALLLLILTLVGLGLGPQLVGIASDLLKPRFGVDALRYALLIAVTPSILAAWCFWQATRTLREEVAITDLGA
jgi:predicted MFS family arabinose efflux permease